MNVHGFLFTNIHEQLMNVIVHEQFMIISLGRCSPDLLLSQLSCIKLSHDKKKILTGIFVLIVVFGLWPNILSLLQFSLVVIPLCPIFVMLFHHEFLFNQHQTLAQ